jgi:hypothetical protein
MYLSCRLTFLILVAVSSPVYAGEWHSATADTQEEAMQRATDIAKGRATAKKTCFKPAWSKQVQQDNPCVKEDGGVKCFATSANEHGSCSKGKYGWLDYNINELDKAWSIGPIPVYPELPTSIKPKPLPTTLPEPKEPLPNP